MRVSECTSYASSSAAPLYGVVQCCSVVWCVAWRVVLPLQCVRVLPALHVRAIDLAGRCNAHWLAVVQAEGCRLLQTHKRMRRQTRRDERQCTISSHFFTAIRESTGDSTCGACATTSANTTSATPTNEFFRCCKCQENLQNWVFKIGERERSYARALHERPAQRPGVRGTGGGGVAGAH